MIIADKRDYKNGYRKNYSAYKNLEKNNDNILARCMLLFYSVECGLKCRLLEEWQIDSTKIIQNEKDDGNYDVIRTHDIQRILKNLKSPRYHFPVICTKHGDSINAESFHQLCRYGIMLKDRDKEKIKLYENELIKVKEWIEEEI